MKARGALLALAVSMVVWLFASCSGDGGGRESVAPATQSMIWGSSQWGESPWENK